MKDLLSAGMKSFAITYDELREFLLDEIGLDIKAYIDRILCVDSITRNDDRHFDVRIIILLFYTRIRYTGQHLFSIMVLPVCLISSAIL